jgi:endonuclease/exonuclease/phosphatase family metal-dependent hydrolase
VADADQEGERDVSSRLTLLTVAGIVCGAVGGLALGQVVGPPGRSPAQGQVVAQLTGPTHAAATTSTATAAPTPVAAQPTAPRERRAAAPARAIATRHRPPPSAAPSPQRLLTIDRGALLSAQRELERRVVSELRRTGQPTRFTLMTFNVLGSSHTRPGADAAEYAPGRLRTEWAAGFVQGHGADIVGFQEMEAEQYDAFMAATGNQFEAYPGRSLPGRAVMSTLAWRSSAWRAVERTTLTVPFMRWRQQVPLVLLENRSTGRQVWVLNVHNAPRSWQAQRDQATATEIAVIRQLRRGGYPVLFIGDMNERNPILCRVTRRTDLYSAAGGGFQGAGRCDPPRVAKIDFLFASPEARFSSFVVDRSPLVRQSTDHAVLHATVTLAP